MTKFSPNFLSDADMALLDRPGVLSRLKDAAMEGKLSRDDFAQLKRDLGQFRRAEDGDRARPDLYSPDVEPSVANKHGYPTPFMPRETHRPDRAANPEVMGYMRGINQRLEDEQITAELQGRRGTDADRPLPPPTLRDQIEAAVNLHATEE
ncbi:hypothetical protein [Variovorax fucosicus]|uniref:hypothetical protein n=1 Tax=Variovorax fucosicus TaxID=3053517 RepID=UPI002577398F|nr:hypothetical protein [Variovorax sp. J22G47]MDM0057348.1 hypothetical protein [Variovorax sp. J22G47]